MDNNFLLVGLGLSGLLFPCFLRRAFFYEVHDEICGLLLPATGLSCYFFLFEKALANLLFGILGIVVVRFECSCTSDRHITMPAIFVSYTYDIYLSMIYFC